MFKLICIFFILSSSIGYCKPIEKYSITESSSYVTDLDLALKLSKETKQEIILIFSASWCGFCNKLKTDLPKIKGLDNKIICIIDTDKDKKLARLFKAKSLPTSVILDINGNEKTRIVGYDKVSYDKWLNSK